MGHFSCTAIGALGFISLSKFDLRPAAVSIHPYNFALGYWHSLLLILGFKKPYQARGVTVQLSQAGILLSFLYVQVI